VNRELERIPKEAITTYCYGVTPDSAEDTGKNYKNKLQKSYSDNRTRNLPHANYFEAFAILITVFLLQNIY